MLQLHNNPNHPEQKHWHQSFVLLLLLGLVAAGALLVQAHLKQAKQNPAKFGATYSTKYAYQLGLDTHTTYVAMLDELGVRDIRIPLYWSDIEKQPGKYDWGEAKWLAWEAQKRGAKVTFAIGMRTPRYPECHLPEWAKTLSTETLQDNLLLYVKAGIQELDTSPAVTAWQIENEPFFAYFGECPTLAPDFYASEIAAAKAATKKPIVVTSSGEFGSWLKESTFADSVGISLYRGAYLEKLGYFAYPIPAWYYTIRHMLSKPFVSHMFISELQVEPWLTKDIAQTPVEDQLKLMPQSKVQEHIEFARATGFDQVWLWGVEWWYYLKYFHGMPEFWNAGKELFQSSTEHAE